ncbi:MAG: hypothetical protein LLF80_02375 [Porphyromonadaceae bacterium]|nr:hypothetical protein [Porphyromonadaceae bacterium]
MRIFTLSIVLISLVSSGIFMQSCTNDDVEDKLYAEYLDLDVYKNTKFTTSEMEIIMKAMKRIGKQSFFDGEKLEVLDKKTLNQLNISERLYNYIYPGMYKDNNFKSPRLKLKYESESAQEGFITTVTTTYSHAETVEMFAYVNAILLNTSTWATVLGSFGIPIIAVTYLQSLNWANLQSKYGDSTNGCEFTIIQVYDPTIGCSTEIYQLTVK